MKASGIQGDIIPASRRPDGSLRKPIKVRPGFIPVEDQIKFASERQLGKEYLTPVLENFVAGSSQPRNQPEQIPISKAKKKNQKRKEKRLQERFEDLNLESTTPVVAQESAQITVQSIEKQKRAIAKKLRQIEELEEQQRQGKELAIEQLSKISKKQELQKMLSEFDSFL
jgi:partner of Y14 and mago protein